MKQSPRKRAMQQQRTIPSMPMPSSSSSSSSSSVPFSFNYDMTRIPPKAPAAASKESTKRMTTSSASTLTTTSLPPTVYKTAVKKDNLFDLQVQLGLMKPTAEQMKLKAPVTLFPSCLIALYSLETRTKLSFFF